MHSDAIDGIRAHISKLKRVKDEDLEGHEGNEMDKDEVTGDRLKTLCSLKCPNEGVLSTLLPALFTRDKMHWVQSQTQKHSIFKAGYVSIVYFTENSRSEWCMLY